MLQIKQNKKQIEFKLKKMPILIQNDENNSEMCKGLQDSQTAFNELQMHSKTIENQVQQIQNISTSTLVNFDTLKYRKINVEAIINTLSSFQELNKIMP